MPRNNLFWEKADRATRLFYGGAVAAGTTALGSLNAYNSYNRTFNQTPRTYRKPVIEPMPAKRKYRQSLSKRTRQRITGQFSDRRFTLPSTNAARYPAFHSLQNLNHRLNAFLGHSTPNLPSNRPRMVRYRRRRTARTRFVSRKRTRRFQRKRYGKSKRRVRLSGKGRHQVARYTKGSLLGRKILIRPNVSKNTFRRYQFKDMHVMAPVVWFDRGGGEDPRMYPGYVSVKCTRPFHWFNHAEAYNTITADLTVTCPQLHEVSEYTLAVVEAVNVRFVIRRKNMSKAMLAPMWMGSYVTDHSDDHLGSPFVEAKHLTHEWIRMNQKALGARLIVGTPSAYGGSTGPNKPWTFKRTVKPVDWTDHPKKLIDNSELEFNWNQGQPGSPPSKVLQVHLWFLPAFNDLDAENLLKEDAFWVETYVTYDMILYGRRDSQTHEDYTGTDVLDADRHPPSADHLHS